MDESERRRRRQKQISSFRPEGTGETPEESEAGKPPPPGVGVNKAQWPGQEAAVALLGKNCLQITELTRINFQGGAK